MLGNSDEFSELLKTGFPMYLLIAIPLLLIMSPVSPANAAHEFTVYRAQQYSLQGATFGNAIFPFQTKFIGILCFDFVCSFGNRFEKQYN